MRVASAVRGVLPSACERAIGGQPVHGRASNDAYYQEIGYAKSSTTWLNAVYFHPTAAAARASYAGLLAGARSQCDSSVATDIGEDGASVPATAASTTTVTVPVGGIRRFTVAASTRLTDPQQANGRYQDQWSFAVFGLAGSTIVEVQVHRSTPMTATERRDARRAVPTVAQRMSSLP